MPFLLPGQAKVYALLYLLEPCLSIHPHPLEESHARHTGQFISCNSQQLTARGTKLLTAQTARTLGNGYARYGNIAVSLTKAAIEGQTAVLIFTCRGTWVYRINEARIEVLVRGRPRLAALQLLRRFPGIAWAGIGGMADNQELPIDVTHIHVLILFPTV